MLPRQAWTSLAVKPDTLLRWHRQLLARRWTYPHRKPGRPPLDLSVRAVILRLSGENPHSGYRRIARELKGAGIAVSATSVRKVLLEQGLQPAPARSRSTWRAFLRARQFADAQPFRFLIHDGDAKFSRAFDEVFHMQGITVGRTPIQAPNANAFAERWVRTVRGECLDRILSLGRRHLDHVLRTYRRHYNEHLPIGEAKACRYFGGAGGAIFVAPSPRSALELPGVLGQGEAC